MSAKTVAKNWEQWKDPLYLQNIGLAYANQANTPPYILSNVIDAMQRNARLRFYKPQRQERRAA